MMKKNSYYILAFILAAAAYFTGCTDLFTNPSNSGTSSKIKITLQSPASNDSISYSGAQINYTITQNIGIDFIELYVNGVIHKWNPPNSNGTQPTIILSLDSTAIGSRISYFLIYYDKDGTSARSDTMKNILVTEPRFPPYAPYNVTLTRLSSSIVNLAWKDSSLGEAPGYEIWRKAGFNGAYKLQLVSQPYTFNINDTDAPDTTIYYYKIRGINKNGTSDFSAEVNTYGGGASHSIPPPTNVQAVATANTVVHVTWQYSNPGGINLFKIERRYSWSSYSVAGSVSSSTTAFVDSANGLVPGMDYYYRVKAYSSKDSSWSNEVYVRTPAN